MMGSAKKILVCGLVLLLTMGSVSAAYPDRPVTIVHAYPGGTVDIVTRYLAEKLSALWKQTVLVETRPGAAEIIAGNTVAKSPADGYTLFLGGDSNFTSNQYLNTKMPFDPEHDLVPITELFKLPFVLMVPVDFPANSMSEFVKLMKSAPGKYQYASIGYGSASHVSMEALLLALDLQMLHVPYKVGPQLTQDLLAGRVNAMIGGPNTAAPHVAAGKLKVLGVSGAQRQKSLPGSPTFSEAGYSQINIQTFIGLAAPKGTPPAIVEKIQASIKTVLASEDFALKIGDPFGYLPVASTPSEFAEMLSQQRVEAQKQFKRLGLKAE